MPRANMEVFMSGDVTVRRATAADLDGVLRLYEELADGRVEALPARHTDAVGLSTTIWSQPGRFLLVAVKDDRPLGTADLLIVPNLTHGGAPWAIVENVVVAGEARRTGIGRLLMDDIVRLCEKFGCYKIQLLSGKHRHEAHGFYRRLGFEQQANGFRRYLA
jgi:GNAT superfamily N-acetyltransferase